MVPPRSSPKEVMFDTLHLIHTWWHVWFDTGISLYISIIRNSETWEVEGIRQRGHLKKTWWDCVKNDMES